MEEKLNSLTNVLQWTIAQSKTENCNGRTEEELEEMKKNMEKKENREFLSKVMKSDVEYLKEFVEIIKNKDSKEEEVLNAVCELQNFVEQIDNANDLDKIGGLIHVIKLTQSDNKEIRENAFVVVGMVAQNNPEGKKKILEKGGLVYMIKTLRDEKELKVLERCIFAFSSISKHVVEIQDAIIKMKGFECLIDILKRKEITDSIKMKIIFLLGRLFTENPKKFGLHFVEIQVPLVLSEIFNSFHLESSLDLIDKTVSFTNQILLHSPSIQKEIDFSNLFLSLKELLEKRKNIEKEDFEFIDQILQSLKK